MNHILIIEDDQDIREAVRMLLESEGYRVSEAENGAQGLSMMHDHVDLVILDIMMPGLSGIDVCRQIRTTSVVPILFLTAKSSEDDKLTGLVAGADDYLCKPFSQAELYARIQALLRRHQIYDRDTGSAEQDWIEGHGLRINTRYNYIFRSGEELHLTDLEYKILLHFFRHPDALFSPQQLYELIWQEPFFNTSSNTVMVHIRNLRSKIEADPQKPEIIKTVWGKGYRLG